MSFESTQQALSDAPTEPVGTSRDQGLSDAINKPWSQVPRDHVRYQKLSSVPRHNVGTRPSAQKPAGVAHAENTLTESKWAPVGGSDALRQAIGHGPQWTSAVAPVPRVTRAPRQTLTPYAAPEKEAQLPYVIPKLEEPPAQSMVPEDTIRVVSSYVPSRSQLKEPRPPQKAKVPQIVPGRTPEQNQVLEVVETMQWGGVSHNAAPQTMQISTVKVANGRTFSAPPLPPAEEESTPKPRRSAMGLLITMFVLGVVWFISSFGAALNPRTVVEDYFSALEAGDIESAYDFEQSLIASAHRPVTNASYAHVVHAPSDFVLGETDVKGSRARVEVSWTQGETFQVAEVILERDLVGPFKVVPQWKVAQGVMRPVVLQVIGIIERDEPYELKISGAEKPVLVGPYGESTVIALPPGTYTVEPPAGDKYSNFGEEHVIEVTPELLNAQSLTFAEEFTDQ